MPRAANARLILLAAAFCLMAPGCTGSRWARSHPGYAAKYPHHTGNLGRMTKQAIDARHVAGETGFYAGAVGQDDPLSAGVNFGMLHFPKLYAGSVEWHGGLQGLLTSGDQPISGGLNGGIRLQTPSRLAPFVGVGAYVGSAPGEPDSGEESDALLAAYPEAGVHLWLTPRVRMTGSASYYVTTSEVNREFPLVGLSLTYLPFESPTEHVPLADRGASLDCGEALDASESWPSEPWPSHGEPSSQPWPEPAETPILSSPPAVNPAYESLPLLAP